MNDSPEHLHPCLKCKGENTEVRGRVERMRDIPARIIQQCNDCGCIWYTRDLVADPRETDANQT